MESAVQWHLLYTQIRDGLISKQEAQFRLKFLEVSLKDSYLKHSNRKEESSLCFPLEGYTRSAIGGKKGSGYQAQGYDFFDGDQHRGHPGHDIFIRDRDQKGSDDSTGKSVNVISASSGIIVSINSNWEPSSPVRGGNTIWIYEPVESRYYYYAHLQEIFVIIGRIVSRGERIGTVGRTGKNAYPKRSPTHLHFTVHYSIEGCPMPVDPYRELVKGSCG
jgi:peptidoglycan LD-endopeptidase LytH